MFQLVFEALHSQEPRGYVVGWIIAISLLVGILIFLLLAVLLWKVNTGAPPTVREGFAAARCVSESCCVRLSTLRRSVQLEGGGQLDGARSRYLNNREKDMSQARTVIHTAVPLA